MLLPETSCYRRRAHAANANDLPNVLAPIFAFVHEQRRNLRVVENLLLDKHTLNLS